MSGISSPGIGSGLDVKSIVDALVKAEITPTKNRLDRQEADLTTKLSAFGQIKSALAKLQTSMMKLADLSQFNTLTTSVSDNSALTTSISSSSAASPGNYQLQVQQLATQQNLASAAFASSATTVGDGTLTINFGTYSNNNTVFTANPSAQPLTITISPGQDSLASIRDAINNSGSGVQASIVQDNTGARLTLMSTNTGQASAMQITVADSDGNNTDASGLSALAYDPTTGVNSLTQTVAAVDSQVYINGLLLTQSTNQLQTAIQGININLLKAQPGVNVNLSVSTNQTQVTSMVNDFIKQYNDTMSTLNSLTSYDPSTKKGSPLQSDAGVRALKFSLSSLLSQSIGSNSGSIQSLADLGIMSDDKGLLSMDSNTFNNALNTNANAIATFFAKSATTTDPNIRVQSVGLNVAAGSYAIAINSFTPGSTLSGTIGGIFASSTDGRTLNGSGIYAGLSLDVLAGSTGDRGFVQVTDGLAAQFNNLLSTYLDTGGTLESRTDQINSGLDDVSKQRDQLALRAQSLADRYSKQFTALDTLLSSMQNTSNFLSQQLANLPLSNQKRN
ncbi:Flagellar cap protein [Legionella massiliensis]|uniref:Flagellar hook-associated protein 2 n=1 Tax=Legionella massiliensis TaxID=1034943 RepID=A0A078L2K8_9GAMM|nr:flagellar filament capping protein FliD [Legionella massiliensis]CDZ78354.1 Flagellar cap protein [Legionella massiliensis]CEE14092.1 Flagellar hook-associated protein 2 [Legionella massiliensis]